MACFSTSSVASLHRMHRLTTFSFTSSCTLISPFPVFLRLHFHKQLLHAEAYARAVPVIWTAGAAFPGFFRLRPRFREQVITCLQFTGSRRRGLEIAVIAAPRLIFCIPRVNRPCLHLFPFPFLIFRFLYPWAKWFDNRLPLFQKEKQIIWQISMPAGISHNFTVLIISKAGAAPCFQMPHRHRSLYTVLAKKRSVVFCKYRSNQRIAIRPKCTGQYSLWLIPYIFKY